MNYNIFEYLKNVKSAYTLTDKYLLLNLPGIDESIPIKFNEIKDYIDSLNASLVCLFSKIMFKNDIKYSNPSNFTDRNNLLYINTGLNDCYVGFNIGESIEYYKKAAVLYIIFGDYLLIQDNWDNKIMDNNKIMPFQVLFCFKIKLNNSDISFETTLIPKLCIYKNNFKNNNIGLFYINKNALCGNDILHNMSSISYDIIKYDINDLLKDSLSIIKNICYL